VFLLGGKNNGQRLGRHGGEGLAVDRIGSLRSDGLFQRMWSVVQLAMEGFPIAKVRKSRWVGLKGQGVSGE
jgi:hypothetical protein